MINLHVKIHRLKSDFILKLSLGHGLNY